MSVMPSVLLHDPLAFVDAAAEEILSRLETLLATHPQVVLLLTGGSTPRAIYARMAQARTRLDWSRIRFGFGDERMVPPEHEDSNFRMASETLLSPLEIPPSHIWRMEGELSPPEAARRYEQVLREGLGQHGRSCHLLLLGMGDDAHCASLFPHTQGLAEHRRWVMENWVPKLQTWRLTLTYPALNAADQVLFLVNGEKKASALAQVLKGARDVLQYPAQGVQPEAGKLTWLVDQAAASQLWESSEADERHARLALGKG